MHRDRRPPGLWWTAGWSVSDSQDYRYAAEPRRRPRGPRGRPRKRGRRRTSRKKTSLRCGTVPDRIRWQKRQQPGERVSLRGLHGWAARGPSGTSDGCPAVGNHVARREQRLGLLIRPIMLSVILWGVCADARRPLPAPFPRQQEPGTVRLRGPRLPQG